MSDLSRVLAWRWWPVLWGILGALTVFCAVRGLQPSLPYRIDFEVYRMGGQLVLDGKPLYGELPPLRDGMVLPFTYPPVAAALFAGLALLPHELGAALFALASVAALWGCAALVARELWGLSRSDAWRLTLPVLSLGLLLGPVRETLVLGQVNLLLMLAAVAGLLSDCRPGARERWLRWGPLLVGFVAAIKLTPLVFGLFYLVRRDLRGAVLVVVGFAMSTGVGFLLLPQDSVQYWSGTLGRTERIGDLGFAGNQGVNGLLHRLLQHSPQTTLLWLVLCVAIVVGMAAVAWRLVRAGRNPEAIVAVALVALLCSPVSWSHHWVWCVPALLILVAGVLEAGPGRRRAAVALVVGLVGLYATPYQLLPKNDDAELSWAWWQHLLGNTYLVWSVFLIAHLWTAAADRRTDPTPATMASPDQP